MEFNSGFKGLTAVLYIAVYSSNCALKYYSCM